MKKLLFIPCALALLLTACRAPVYEPDYFATERSSGTPTWTTCGLGADEVSEIRTLLKRYFSYREKALLGETVDPESDPSFAPSVLRDQVNAWSKNQLQAWEKAETVPTDCQISYSVREVTEHIDTGMISLQIHEFIDLSYETEGVPRQKTLVLVHLLSIDPISHASPVFTGDLVSNSTHIWVMSDGAEDVTSNSQKLWADSGVDEETISGVNDQLARYFSLREAAFKEDLPGDDPELADELERLTVDWAVWAKQESPAVTVEVVSAELQYSIQSVEMEEVGAATHIKLQVSERRTELTLEDDILAREAVIHDLLVVTDADGLRLVEDRSTEEPLPLTADQSVQLRGLAETLRSTLEAALAGKSYPEDCILEFRQWLELKEYYTGWLAVTGLTAGESELVFRLCASRFDRESGEGELEFGVALIPRGGMYFGYDTVCTLLLTVPGQGGLTVRGVEITR